MHIIACGKAPFTALDNNDTCLMVMLRKVDGISEIDIHLLGEGVFFVGASQSER